MEQKMTTISGKNFTSIETGSMNEWKEVVKKAQRRSSVTFLLRLFAYRQIVKG